MVDLSCDVDDVGPREKIKRRQVGPFNDEETPGKVRKGSRSQTVMLAQFGDPWKCINRSYVIHYVHSSCGRALSLYLAQLVLGLLVMDESCVRSLLLKASWIRVLSWFLDLSPL